MSEKIEVLEILKSSKGLSEIILVGGEVIVASTHDLRHTGLKSGDEIEIDESMPDVHYSFNGFVLFTKEYI